MSERRVEIRSPGPDWRYEQITHIGNPAYAFRTDSGKVEFWPYIETENMIYRPLENPPWPLPAFGVEPKPIPDEELWIAVNEYLKAHIEFFDENLYDVVTAWIFASWIPELWFALPYLYITGPKNSGKTRVLEVLHRLCRRAILAANISEAALFRAVEAWKPTLLLDEAEIYGAEQKASIQNLLNSGYRRDQKVIRVEKIEGETPVLKTFDVFGFKALAGTGVLKDTLESRAIIISMEKNIAPIRLTLEEKLAEELRGQLLLWRFRRLTPETITGGAVADVSDVSDVFLEGGLPINGRFTELFYPLIKVANHGREGILNFARTYLEDQLSEESVSIEARVVEALIKSKDFVENGIISTKKVAEVLNQDVPPEEVLNVRQIGWVIRRLGLRPRRTPDRRSRGWLWNEARIMRLARRYGVVEVQIPLNVSIPPSEKTSEMSKTSHNNVTYPPDLPTLLKTLDSHLRRQIIPIPAETIAKDLNLPLETIEGVLATLERDGRAVRLPDTNLWRAV